MEPLSQAVEIVRQAEDDLRNLLLRAAEQGDYGTASMLAEWAKKLKDMQNGSLGRELNKLALHKSQPEATAELSGATTERLGAANGQLADSRRPEALQTSKPKTKRTRREYPKFLRDGEELLKIGWSKRRKGFYRHKAPKRVVLLVTQALQRAAQNGDRFIMDQIFPIRDRESDAEVPTYQAYLSLAWLRKEKLIVQHGRQGYSLSSDTDLTDAVEERWKLLPKS
jgi:hypothetical protein